METVKINRNMTMQTEDNYKVSGYATTFDPYVLYEYDDVKVIEDIDRDAFKDTDMSDVIMQFDHGGPVFARTSNGTLSLSIDDHGLKVEADLSRTKRGQELYDDIKAGMITGMSFSATVERKWCGNSVTITRMKRLFDVSAVSIPANPGTEITARNKKIAEEQTKLDAIENKKKRLALTLSLETE